MSAPPTAVAVTITVSASMPQLAASVTARADTPDHTARIWTIALTNGGIGEATDAQITALTDWASIRGCTAVVKTPLPAGLGGIPAGGKAEAPITIDFSHCHDLRVFVTIHFQSNGGEYTGSTRLTNQDK